MTPVSILSTTADCFQFSRSRVNLFNKPNPAKQYKVDDNLSGVFHLRLCLFVRYGGRPSYHVNT